MSAWVNDLKNSTGKYFGIKFNAKDEQGSGEVVPPVSPEDLDDDIPF